MTKEIENLIVKYLTGSATASDLDILADWISNPLNDRIFKNYVETYYAIICSTKNNDSQKTVDGLLRSIRKEKSAVHQLKRNILFKYAAAASIILFVSLTLFLNKNNQIIESTDTFSVDHQIKTGSNKAILTLENGEEVSLEKGNSIHTPNATSNGEEIIYNETPSKDIVYNLITIPRGGQFSVKLSDGTQIWLNSESQLKYPTNFIDGETRTVELIYGEAYFDVSPSTRHDGSTFNVVTGTQNIEVLGTHFNIKAYRDENAIYTTLVKGKVAIGFNSTKEILKPGQQSILNVNSESLKIEPVDVFDEVSWKDGVFSFNNMPLKNIMKVLSRWYDIDVKFQNKDLEIIDFNGALRKNQSFEEIISVIKNTNNIEYEINGKTVIIK